MWEWAFSDSLVPYHLLQVPLAAAGVRAASSGSSAACVPAAGAAAAGGC
jgi:hypothetical protein